MNRPIKFRGISIEPLVGDDQWVYGFGVHKVQYTDGSESYHLYTDNGDYEVDPETVGQVFDFGDKNEEELYPGDIIKTTHTKTVGGETEIGPFGMPQVEEYKKIGVLDYYRGYTFGPRLRWRKGHMMIPNTSTLWRMKAIKIGNIYDNPELLEVQA